MNPRQVIPPLRGDGNGCYKIHLIGNSGAGKSTLGARLSKLLNIPHIPLDELNWLPGWEELPEDDFRARLLAVVEEHPNGWIIDGNYTSKGGSMLNQFSTDTIWLDPPLPVYFGRILIRTFLRVLGLRPTCSPGCPESFWAAFSRDGILWWCLSQHWIVRRRGQELMQQYGIGVGTIAGERKMRRIGGSGKELESWLADVKNFVHPGDDTESG